MKPTLCPFTLLLLATSVSGQGRGKPWCKGRNFPGGRECCESEDPEGSKCTEGQGDCDSDAGCAGDLVCGSNNCRDYHRDASPSDDCCTRPTTHSFHGGKTGGLPSRSFGLFGQSTTGFRGRFNKAGGKPIADVGIDFTKFNDETYGEHYGDGFTKWNPGSASVSGTDKAGRAEAGFGNNAFGATYYAEGTGNTGRIGIDNSILGRKDRFSLGYQLRADNSDSHVSAEAGIGANAEAEIVPGIGVGAGFGIGAGYDAGLNKKDRNLGATAITPVGTFGAHLGCKNKICVFGCFTLTVC